ncbi:hypothetical protein Bhyg_10031 [Pseudolycoriella hygida]|uniref:Uncharacterized protein n=1 Tax=Pseudolycoriella hygida TaxID=35572 RepID=A0A9Q0MSP9_9DIPT|nr:hypothetical protein Bhyg_10031 [Pseudolycoriella hygida]
MISIWYNNNDNNRDWQQPQNQVQQQKSATSSPPQSSNKFQDKMGKRDIKRGSLQRTSEGGEMTNHKQTDILDLKSFIFAIKNDPNIDFFDLIFKFLIYWCVSISMNKLMYLNMTVKYNVLKKFIVLHKIQQTIYQTKNTKRTTQFRIEIHTLYCRSAFSSKVFFINAGILDI